MSRASTVRVPFNALTPHEDSGDVDSAIRRVIDRGWFVLGPEVEAFESEFAAASGAAHAIGVGTGTDAISLTLRALDVGPGDEVITSPLSAAYSALAIMMAGARPVFVDLDPDRLTMDPARVEAAVTPRTRALLPVHLYGQPADTAPLMTIAGRHSLAVVEDACQAHLATYNRHPVGTMGIAGAFSFYPTKNLGAMGDGGAVITNDASLAARLRRLRNGGQTSRYQHLEPGANSRLDEMQAAILRARLPYLRTWTEKRRVLARRYRAALVGASITVPPELESGHVYHLFPIRTSARAELQAHLKAAGIETLVHYPVPIPRQPALAGTSPDQCPIADRICDELLSLPLYPTLDESDVDFIASAVRTFAPGAPQAP